MCSAPACALVDAPAACRPCKTLTNPFRRWSEKGIFQLIFEPRLMGCPKGGLTSKRPVVCDGKGQPVRLLLSERQCSDFGVAEVLLRDLPEASVLLGDKGYDSNKIRTMVLEQGITPCIPSGRNRNERIPYSKRLYKMRHRVENLLARLKDWRRTTTRYDRCAHIFLSAALLAATLIFW